MKKILHITSFVIIAFIIGAIVRTSFAGSLTPLSTPASSMYTLESIYTKLTTTNATTATEGAQSFTTPGSVSATFHTLKQIYEAIPTLDATKIASGTTYLGVAGTMTAGGLPRTGQTLCHQYDGVSAFIPVACAGTGQDGDTLAGIARSYTDNGNGTITDNATSLVWQKQDDGTTKTQPNALAYCNANTAALPGTGWRLPNIIELESIVDYGVAAHINTTYFTSPQLYYWSSTRLASGVHQIWYFGYGTSPFQAADNEGFTLAVRCVRSQ